MLTTRIRRLAAENSMFITTCAKYAEFGVESSSYVICLLMCAGLLVKQKVYLLVKNYGHNTIIFEICTEIRHTN
jgi:hypothetical protein